MIMSFADEATADLFHGRSTSRVRRLPRDVQKRALYKLDVLNGAHALEDLRVPPGNQLELLIGNLAGFHSIRVNRQWRIIFHWIEGNAHDVALVDYH